MKTNKRGVFNMMGLTLLGSALMISCNNDDPAANGTVILKMEASSATGSTINGRTQTTTVITDFKVNIREVEFEFDEEDAHFKTDSSFNDDVKLKGPFVLDLLDQNGFVEGLVTTANVPNARYEEVEFKFHKNTEAGEMDGKSIMITGTINGSPFVFWHDTDEEFEIDFENTATDLVVNGNTAAIAINFHFDRLFSAVKGGLDLSSAVDGDGNGVIEINPFDNDGNRDRAHALKTLLEDATDLIDDNH